MEGRTVGCVENMVNVVYFEANDRLEKFFGPIACFAVQGGT